MTGHQRYTLILKDNGTVVFKQTSSHIPIAPLSKFLKHKYGISKPISKRDKGLKEKSTSLERLNLEYEDIDYVGDVI